ncbi:MAG: alcohol dehydrogenase [Phycisphaeraceae bacterium]|nr:alcohol dehydrogenase [Phycisphaeraceae bacterium]
MKTTAAVLFRTAAPLEVVDLEVPVLQPGQVLVEVTYTGVCRTQWLECRGHRGTDRYLPHCLGHEGSGIVVDVGPEVRKARPGQAVVLSWIKGDGAEVPGCTYRCGDTVVNAGAITTFAQHAVISENRLTPLPPSIPMREAAMLGCAVATGFGAVINACGARPDQSVAVFGAGGVGSCAVLGAVAAVRCATVIAIDRIDAKLDLAGRWGATPIDIRRDDPVERVAALCPGGCDFAIEATGRPEVMDQALRCVRPRGGAAVVIGNAPKGATLQIDPGQLNLGKRLLGTWGGDCAPDRDLPRFANLIARRDIDLTTLMSDDYPLSRINEALDDLESGRVVRAIVRPGPAPEPTHARAAGMAELST